VIDDGWIKETYQCRNGPCGPNANPSLHRSQCCFHPFNDEYTDGKVVYECCALKCLRELKCDIRTTHITTMYHRKLCRCSCCTLLQLEGTRCSMCLKTVGTKPRSTNYSRARFVCLADGNATGPMEPVQGRELSQLRWTTYFFPNHIGAEISEHPDHTLQAHHNMSLDPV
jgi:hypothetical protein